MTLVLFILSMILGAFVSAAMNSMMAAKRELTNKRMEEIDQQILWYRQVNHRLPCPAPDGLTTADPGYGVADRTGDCANAASGYPGAVEVAEGNVPTKQLGLDDEYMYDGWGRRFRYMVLQEFTRDCAFTLHPVVGGGYPGIIIRYRDNSTVTTDRVLYTLLSHGLNGHGGTLQSGAVYSASSTNTNEHENCDCDGNAAATTMDREFVEEYYEEDNTSLANRFDDILRYARRENLLSQNEVEGVTEVCP